MKWEARGEKWRRGDIEIGDSVVHSLRFLIGVGELQIMLVGISNQ